MLTFGQSCHILVSMLQLVDGPKTYPLEGRVATIVLYLARRAELVNGHNKLKLEFNCKDRLVQPKFEVFEEAIQSEK